MKKDKLILWKDPVISVGRRRFIKSLGYYTDQLVDVTDKDIEQGYVNHWGGSFWNYEDLPDLQEKFDVEIKDSSKEIRKNELDKSTKKIT